MNIEQLQAKREGFLASARELAAGDGDLAQVKSLMAEAKNIEERIETIKSLGVTAPVASAPVEDKPWKPGGVSKRITDLLPGDTAEERNYKAYAWGQWARSIMGNRKATDWVKNHIKANEGTDSAGALQFQIHLALTLSTCVSSLVLHVRTAASTRCRATRSVCLTLLPPPRSTIRVRTPQSRCLT